MIAACYRKSGNYQQALQYYKMIHRKFSDNIDCVKFLIRICHDLNLPELNEYTEKLKKLEKAKEVKERKNQNETKLSSGNRSVRRSADSLRGDSASSNSSGYMTSTSISSRLGQKRKSVIETIENKASEEDTLIDEDIFKGKERPVTTWRKKYDDFENDEIADILPE